MFANRLIFHRSKCSNASYIALLQSEFAKQAIFMLCMSLEIAVLFP